MPKAFFATQLKYIPNRKLWRSGTVMGFNLVFSSVVYYSVGRILSQMCFGTFGQSTDSSCRVDLPFKQSLMFHVRCQFYYTHSIVC